MNENAFSSFQIEDLCGWEGGKNPDLLKEELSKYGQFEGEYKQLNIIGDSPQKDRVMYYELIRKVLGNDIPNLPQAIGDCTAWGTKHTLECLSCIQIALGTREEFKLQSSSYIYGCERVYIGGGSLWADGGVGVWCSKSIPKFGTISLDTPGCPSYSANNAKDWGRNGPPKDLVKIGQEHTVKSSAQINSINDAYNALSNGYPFIVCSNYGFKMSLDSEGFNRASGTWNHCMCCLGYRKKDGKHPACFYIQNSWGPGMFEIIKDWDTDANWPECVLRIREDDLAAMLSQGDSFSFSEFNGFPAKELPESFFASF